MSFNCLAQLDSSDIILSSLHVIFDIIREFFISIIVTILSMLKIIRTRYYALNRKIKKTEISDYPPSILIDALIAPERAIDMQANLAETFPLWVGRHGLAAAHRIRKIQIARLIVGEYWNKAIALAKAFKLGGA